MAAPTGTFQTYSANTNREDLQDWIAIISPTDRPFCGNVGESTAINIKHEWSTYSLAAASTTNAQIEGTDIAGSTSAAPTRVNNYCQILSKDITVSRSQRKSILAGTQDFYDFQVVNKGREILRDLEAIVVSNTGLQVGAATVARTMQALESWIITNFSANTVTTTVAGASTGATTAGQPSTAASLAKTDASTVRPLIESYVKTVMQNAYTQGGLCTMLQVNPFNKTVVSGFTGRSSSREIVSEGTILGAAQIYASDFGDLRVIPNRFIRTGVAATGNFSAFLIDPEYMAVAYLDRLHEEDIARTGDADKTLLVVECTLEVKQEKAQGAIFDLTGQ